MERTAVVRVHEVLADLEDRQISREDAVLRLHSIPLGSLHEELFTLIREEPAGRDYVMSNIVPQFGQFAEELGVGWQHEAFCYAVN